MRVQSPDGQTWRVTRRWFPWRWRWRDADGGDVPRTIAPRESL